MIGAVRTDKTRKNEDIIERMREGRADREVVLEGYLDRWVIPLGSTLVDVFGSGMLIQKLNIETRGS